MENSSAVGSSSALVYIKLCPPKKENFWTAKFGLNRLSFFILMRIDGHDRDDKNMDWVDKNKDC